MLSWQEMFPENVRMNYECNDIKLRKNPIYHPKALLSGFDGPGAKGSRASMESAAGEKLAFITVSKSGNTTNDMY